MAENWALREGLNDDMLLKAGSAVAQKSFPAASITQPAKISNSTKLVSFVELRGQQKRSFGGVIRLLSMGTKPVCMKTTSILCTTLQHNSSPLISIFLS